MMDKKLRKLIQKHIGQRTSKPKPQWQGSPFRDLDVFEFEHAPIFFGRSRAVGEVVRLLQSTLSKPEPCHFALILGASGSGKSSLARAGVLPLLTRPGVIEGIGLWRCAIVRPSDDSADLFQALVAALLRADKKIGDKKISPDFSVSNFFVANYQPPALPELADPESSDPQKSLAAELRAHPQTVAIRVKDQLNAVAKAHQTQQRRTLEAQIASLTQEGRQADAALKQQSLQNLQEPKARLVLLLDQMEELFTLNYAPEQLRAFLETIHVLARSGRVFVIGTLRSDFYPRYQEQPTLVALARDGARFDLLPPTPDEISQIIRRPARLAALQFEPHPTTAEHTLADTLRDEALADPEALPLLEHVLNRLYQAQLPRADGRLTFADYEEICGADLDPKTGVKTSRGVGGALGKHAEDIFTGQHRPPTDPPPPWTEDTFRAVFRCLVTFGKGEGDTDVPNRRAFTYQDLIQSAPAAQALVDTFIHERLLIADTDAQSRAIVRLSHEALLTRWPRLSQWLQTALVRDLMSQRRRLESSLRQWQEQNRTPDCYLQPGFELEEGKQLLEKHEAALKQEEREFIRESIAYHVTLAESEATRQREIAERERQLKEKAQRANEEAEAALAETICQLERSQVEEGRAWLERGRAALSRGEQSRALIFAGRAIGFAGYNRPVSEGGTFKESFPPLLSKVMKDSYAEEGRAEEYAQATQFISEVCPTLLPLWSGTMKGEATCVAFSPDFRYFASGSNDNTISLWDVSSGKEIASLKGHTDGVSSIAFSSDGTRLASGSKDATIKLWDIVTGTEYASFRGNTKVVTSVAFSPDGSRLASGSWDATVKLWDVASGMELASLVGHGHDVTCVAFSPDGTLLASGSWDATIKLWDALAGSELACLQHSNLVYSLAFSLDGSCLASGSNNGTIKIWDAPGWKEIACFMGSAGTWSIAFSPDCSCLVSGDYDMTVKFWDILSGKQLASLLGHMGNVRGVAFSADGSRIASCSSDMTIKVWDAATAITSFLGHEQNTFIRCVAFSPDGRLLVSGSDDATIKHWDTVTGKLIARFHGHKREVMSVAFAPDGKCLASGSMDNTIRLWDTATGKELAMLQNKREVTSVAFSPCGSRLASGSDKNRKIKVWNVATGKELLDDPPFCLREEWRLYGTDPDEYKDDIDHDEYNEYIHPGDLDSAEAWLKACNQHIHPNGTCVARVDGNSIRLQGIASALDITG